ncbi:hypothetical protein, partial [Micromonospora tulbaghiae]|uniref:hypothetical protein n=1 Tax=Micromonospora tulbaghiae TaxID=479978 RepID=UPI003EBF5A1E
QALLLQSGAGALRVPQIAGVPFRGVFAISLQPSMASAGRTTVMLSPVRGGSHRITWSQTVNLIDEILAFEADARAILVLETLKQEIRDPNWLSDARNEINYDLTSSPFSASIWSSLFVKANSPEELEDELARSVQERVERRFEVVAMALGRLSAQLREEHRRRGGRIDRRQTRARLDLLPSHSWLTQAMTDGRQA